MLPLSSYSPVLVDQPFVHRIQTRKYKISDDLVTISDEKTSLFLAWYCCHRGVINSLRMRIVQNSLTPPPIALHPPQSAVAHCISNNLATRPYMVQR